ncbi:bifunctional hydroxymethylpyrimidine kinase/phosphomethylpyrimidine kinase [Megasphaera vaginalis (ex Bordigoni et al. 2020)]|uniref:bifunctional hydroxymethylpyrimidine kinase/phosphomethylpyrimidine kinase n=1 Tax=Megasphaera vaginalis (ex Bordigoni et al. 2020) TaxID=2045301 RepID=UPI000C7D01EE|nr:bifunctional hydroxymethylpyrimidine kinase/phosphomethylpyrimidine kinase [Megasphaera vaginalis (ex Bordigoni et al. 2020)]
MKHVLSIAGTDPSGGAGAAADCKTFCAHGCFALNVITAVVSQNTQGVRDYMDVTPPLIASQIDAVFEDIDVDAVKIGMVSVVETIRIIAAKLKRYQPPFVVIDPVMVATSGHRLLRPEAEESLRKMLLPLATVLTPNIPEAEVLTGKEIRDFRDMEEAARAIAAMGAQTVLVKGGHRTEDATDLFFDGKEMHYFKGRHIDSTSTHGTGCSLSSAIAADLANGMTLTDAVAAAKAYVFDGIAHAEPIGKGHGPIHHFYGLYEKAGIV